MKNQPIELQKLFFQSGRKIMKTIQKNSIKKMATRFAFLPALALLVLVANVATAQDEVPGPKQTQAIALVKGTIHPVSSEPIENGTIVFVDGKITSIGSGAVIPDGAKIIDCSGKHIYPSMFEAYSQMGLTEIGAVPATIDTSETGNVNPNVKAVVAVNPESALIPVTRSDGVLLAVSAPTSGLVAGQSAVLQLDGWTWEDMALEKSAAMQISWPSLRQRRFRGGGRGGNDSGEAVKRYEAQIAELRELFDSARAYAAGRTANPETQPLDLRLEGMASLVEGKLPMMVRADTLNQIQSAVGFAVEQKVKLIILGGYDAALCSDLLKKHNVPVIISAVQRRPLRRNDAFDAPYTLPMRLAEAGVQFCISASDRSSTWNTRILPIQAAVAAGYGLDRAEALKSVTLYPANIMGVGDRVGSLEVGKHATLFVADGDALEIATQVNHAWIQGRRVDLSNKHKRLYRKYQQKYDQLKGQ